MDWYTKLLERIEKNKASEREVVRICGMTVEEMDKDTTKKDEHSNDRLD